MLKNTSYFRGGDNRLCDNTTRKWYAQQKKHEKLAYIINFYYLCKMEVPFGFSTIFS